MIVAVPLRHFRAHSDVLERTTSHHCGVPVLGRDPIGIANPPGELLRDRLVVEVFWDAARGAWTDKRPVIKPVEPEPVEPEPVEPETVEPETIDEPATVETIDEPATVETIDEPETVETVDEPETVETVDEPETVETVDEPETVEPATVDEPETVKKSARKSRGRKGK